MTIYIILFIALSIIIYWLVFYFYQKKWLYPTSKLAPAQGVTPKTAESIWLEHSEGKTELWWMPAVHSNQAAKPTVIVAHGQLGLIDTWEDRMQGLIDLGFNVLLVEFPGYGRSSGKPSERAFRNTFAAAYDWLIDRDDVDNQQIIGLGRSMGGGVMCQLATVRPLACLWLLSTFTGLRYFVAKRGIPQFIQTEHMDNLAVVSQLDIPILVLHGQADDVVPATHGRALAQVAKNGLLLLEPGDHNSCPAKWAEFWHFATNFYEKNRVGESG